MPANFGNKDIVWTLTTNGKTDKADGTLRPQYAVDEPVMLATFGTVETPYWKNNPGSRQHVPKSPPGVRVLSQEEVAQSIARGIETGKRAILEPKMFRVLFMLNALFPEMTARYVSRLRA